MKIYVKGIKLKKALEILDKDADIELYDKRADGLYNIILIGFNSLDYVVPASEKTKSFVALSFYNINGVLKHIFFDLDEYIQFIVH